MTTIYHKGKIPTTTTILTRQGFAAKPPTTDTAAPNASVPVKTSSAAVAAPDTRTPTQQYLDAIAPGNLVGRLIKFSKEGRFVTADDGEPIDENAEFIALADETLIGWIQFRENEPPDRQMGLLYEGFRMPARETLGDNDPATWPVGLSGQAEDPWRHQILLVLQNRDTRELFTFATTSVSGRRAVGTLLRHYDRMARSGGDEVPVVRLKPGGFNHRDDRIGWVATPGFQICGRAARNEAAKPDAEPGFFDDPVP